MKHAMVVGVFGVALLLGSWSRADEPICNGAVALRVNQKGLDFVLDQVKPMIPHTLDTPAIDQVVVDWPLTDSDATAHVPPVKLSLNLKQLLAQMDGGGLRIQGKADVTGGTDFIVDNPYVGLGSTTCTADVGLRDLDVDLSLSFGTQGGRISATVNHAKISFNNDTSVIGVKGCTVGSILTKVVDFVRSHFMSSVQSLMESLAKKKISALVTEKLDETIELTKEVKGYVFTGRLEALQTDGAGVAVGLGVGVRPLKEVQPACLAGANLTPPQTCTGVPVQLSAAADSMFGAGLSEALLNHAVHMVWRSGMLCITSEDPRLATITQGLDKLTAGLDQPPGTKLGFALRLPVVPRVRTTIQSGLELVIDKLEARLTLSPPGGPPGEVMIDAGVSVGAVPWIDPVSNSVTLDLRKVSVGHLDLKGKDGAPSPLSLDPARLQRFITTVLMPVVRERLSQLPLSASVVAIQGFQIELKTFQVSDG